MPNFEYKGKTFHNPVEFVLYKLGGTWKIPILWRIREKKLRYGELKKSISGISHKMLASQLKELEEDGFLTRKVYPVVPPHTEYSITEKGLKAIPLIQSMRKYGMELMKEDGIEVETEVKH